MAKGRIRFTVLVSTFPATAEKDRSEISNQFFAISRRKGVRSQNVGVKLSSSPPFPFRLCETNTTSQTLQTYTNL